MKHMLLAVAMAAALVATTTAFAAPARTETVHLLNITRLLHRPGHGGIVAELDPARTAPCTITINRGSQELRPSRGWNPQNPSWGHWLNWGWSIKPNTPLGRWKIRINCRSAGSLRTSFKVIR